MIELQPHQFALAGPLFATTHYGVLAAGTLEGGHPGRVFVDHLNQPSAALLCTRVGYYFLAGTPTATIMVEVRDLFHQTLAPQQFKALNDPQILLFFPTEDWQQPLFAAFQPDHPIRIHKKRMTLTPGAANALHGWPDCIPDGLCLQPLEPEFLSQHPEIGGEVSLFWGSFEVFWQKSLGCCLVDEAGTIASACHAVFIGAGEAEISIFTAPEYRRRGLATLTASAFIEACLARGLKPIWGCFPENLPSVALARKLGFENAVDQPICFWEWKPE